MRAVPNGSRLLLFRLLQLLLSRLGDVLSTYLATPTLKLEGNALARRFGDSPVTGLDLPQSLRELEAQRFRPRDTKGANA